MRALRLCGVVAVIGVLSGLGPTPARATTTQEVTITVDLADVRSSCTSAPFAYGCTHALTGVGHGANGEAWQVEAAYTRTSTHDCLGYLASGTWSTRQVGAADALSGEIGSPLGPDYDTWKVTDGEGAFAGAQDASATGTNQWIQRVDPPVDTAGVVPRDCQGRTPQWPQGLDEHWLATAVLRFSVVLPG